MTLLQILIFALVALLAGIVTHPQFRRWLLMVGSVLAIYWMQPSMPIRYLDFWLPTLALALTVWVWAIVRPAEAEGKKEDVQAGVILAGVVLLVAGLRYVGPICCLTPTRPPQILSVMLVLGLVIGAGWGLSKGKAAWVGSGVSMLLIGMLIVLKTPALAQAISAGVRGLSGQQTDLATAFDIRWLGFSYLAFRLVHVLKDAGTGRVPALPLDEFVTYALFFPAYTAGPIDRVQRFVGDLKKPFRVGENLLPAGQRLAMGVFKKFALADGLALIALSDTNATQILSPGWGWVVLYAYALRIYFDFSGYTDIAIGLGMLAGVKLPENFDAPYLKPNLTAFWNSWHMTLAQWFRAYYFNPLTRTLRGRKLPIPAVIFLTQVTTMGLIGLWHGVSWNFLIWGVWHGVGLFIHNRWSETFRARYAAWEVSPRVKGILNGVGTVFTFHFVTLGWVWFALSQPGLAWDVFRKLAGG
ncbi:MAG TPA: MBOAT family O-acyltransferase [Anaerolineales bacterium]|nr:MBOAT family O-acyltransferase [Anaerolineales bacterium]